MTWLIPVVLLVLAAVAAIVLAIALKRAIYAIATPICLLAAVAIAYESITSDPDPTPPDPHPSEPFRIVALGDSYISGEGAPRFLRGTDSPGRNECRRAPTAYPHLAARELRAALTFAACSGARTVDVTGVDASGATVPGQQPNSADGIFGAQPQVAELAAVKDPGAVLLSIGGNDAGFAQIGVGCASPTERDCRRSADAWIRRLDRDVYPALVRTYKAVRRAAGQAPVFAVTYPNPLGPKYCGDVWIGDAEMEFLRDVFIPRLATIINAAAESAGIRIIALDHALDGHRICEVGLARAAVNFVTLGRSRGSRLDIRRIKSLIHGTFHPNPLGHELMARIVTPRLRDARDERLEPLPPGEPQDLPPPPFVPDELRPATARPFPARTQCRGERIATVIPVTLPLGATSVPVSGAKSHSVVCFRTYRAQWRSRRADRDGTVRVPVSLEFEGIGSINEILVERPSGAWDEIVLSRHQE